jgi:predicted ATPase
MGYRWYCQIDHKQKNNLTFVERKVKCIFSYFRLLPSSSGVELEQYLNNMRYIELMKGDFERLFLIVSCFLNLIFKSI